MERLWSPWRMTYVTQSTEDTAASGDSRGIFERALASADDLDSLVVHRGEHAFVVMNLYPYNTGHMMVVPNRKVASLEDLDAAEAGEVMQLLQLAMTAGRRVLRCDGFNAGLNVGAVAGAGVADHMHIHLVPRWLGDANFMPITASTMVLPELLPATTARLRAEFATLSVERQNPGWRRTAGALVYLPGERKFVLRRSLDGFHVIPKGRIEKGESAADAAIRELHEETGYRATLTNWCGLETYDHDGKQFHVVIFFASGDATPDVEAHLEHDTLLVDPQDVVSALSFDTQKAIARRGVELVQREFGRDA